MNVRPRLILALAELQHVFRRRCRIETELLARPLGDDGDGRRRREISVLRVAAEIHVDGDVPAPVTVHVMVAAHAEGFERQVDINGGVLIAPALDFKGFAQRLVALADEDEDCTRLGRRDDARGDEDVAEDVPGGRDDLDRLRALTVNKESPSEEVLSKLSKPLRAGKREGDMLRYLAEHTETDPELMKHVIADKTITYEIFTSVAGAAFRGNARPDYPKLIERVRRILGEENGPR